MADVLTNSSITYGWQGDRFNAPTSTPTVGWQGDSVNAPNSTSIVGWQKDIFNAPKSTSIVKWQGDKSYLQLVSADGVFTGVDGGRFKLIENYMYLYHTDTLIVLPTYPESIADSMGVNYQPTTPLARSAPIYSYISSGPRTFQISLPLHRELLYDVNRATALQVGDSINSDDYMNLMIKQIQASALPKYNANEKQVNPPTVAIKFGNDIFCKGVITGAVTATYSGPILKTDSYAMVTLDFTVNEIDPYDAVTVAELGGYRGLNTTLEGRVWGKDV